MDNVKRGRVTKRMMEQTAKDTREWVGKTIGKMKTGWKNEGMYICENPLERNRNRHTAKCLNERADCEWNYLPANLLSNDGAGALWNAWRTWRVPTKTGRTGERHLGASLKTFSLRSLIHLFLSFPYENDILFQAWYKAIHDAEPAVPLSWQGLYMRKEWLWNTDWLDSWTRW